MTGNTGLTIAVSSLGLPSRAENALVRHGIRTVEVLTTWSRLELLTQVVGLGDGSLDLIEAVLAHMGRHLAADDAGRRYHQPRAGTNQRHIKNHHAWAVPAL
ncbi:MULTISPECIES: DNA-directed RNA polymerase subunit alpha C-terminal domain-containing protein [unclassified Arthrobacter]|uniref:DNA-directed RNA polymerase subunit alpha C-terminal domain-containing protein n=1 Tax=unclassified Arthrobacter TaxID=235627 RepID=UPI002883026E|nr:MULTISPECIES: DNA-directed RNA polymerase subunit alpha C-terminal domain-containing protein [unclassified Arthrobacter]